MMALVAYDDSDFTDSDDEQQHNEGSEVSKLGDDDLSSSNPFTLFKSLPQPNAQESVDEEDDEFLKKKEVPTDNTKKETVKITIPSLLDFKDIDVTATRALGHSLKKSDLLGILPRPKSCIISTNILMNKSMVPNAVVNRNKGLNNNGEILSMTKVKSLKGTKIALKHEENESSDIENDNNTDFFSLNTNEDLIPVTSVNILQDPKCFVSPSSESQSANVISPYATNESSIESTSSSMNNTTISSTSTKESSLDEDAIRQLCGSRGRRKMEQINFVDVDQNVVLADAQSWIAKSLTDDTTKRTSSSKRRGDEPSSQQKRKHQITYLAHQAKANEIELQNQWANNRLTKRQTQSKYGF